MVGVYEWMSLRCYVGVDVDWSFFAVVLRVRLGMVEYSFLGIRLSFLF